MSSDQYDIMIFFYNDTANTWIYTLTLRVALPILQTIWTFFSHLISNRLQPKIHISK